jgi:beta-glucosidase
MPTSSVSRRSALKTAVSALAAGWFVPKTIPSAEASPILSSGGALSFPRGFQWGTATAAYQIEGAAAVDGRKPSIWDTFSHTPGKTDDGLTGDVACDFYNRYPDDVKLMSDLGVRHFRFSISWSRVLPEGRGKVNQKGLDFYRKLADTLRAHGITPHATLYHWDLPQALEDSYCGWRSRRVVSDFGEYASVVAKYLGDRITDWMTLNEISSFTYGSYGIAGSPRNHPSQAPGLILKTRKEFNQTVHNALLAHGTACMALRASSPVKPSVSIAENYGAFVPVAETPGNIRAATMAFRRESPNGAIIIPILTGHYDKGWLEDQGDAAPEIAGGDMKIIHQPLDVLGCNCYTGSYVRESSDARGYEVIPFFPGYPRANTAWLRIVPESIYWAVRGVTDGARRKDLPILITENGCADGAVADAEGLVKDTDRIMFYRAYLSQVRRAVTEGYPVKGFFPWSLMDNFEWARGYTQRFGMVHVDYATQKRTPKLSFDWYRQVIRGNALA